MIKRNRVRRTASRTTSARLGLLASLLILSSLASALISSPLAPRGIAFHGASQRFLTPNGAERNVYFWIENDDCTDVSGRVFDVLGHAVAGMTTTGTCGLNGNQALVWDGTGAGHTGVYIYVIQAGGKSFSGTVVVIK